MPQISVIVPVYNVEKYLHRCVDSILAQTFTDFELILVDDGSKDKSGAICEEYACIDNRIVVFHQDNQGQSKARNVALDYVFERGKTEWIAFIDSDDWVHPLYLEMLWSAVTTHNKKISNVFLTHVHSEDDISENTSESFFSSVERMEDVYISFGKEVACYPQGRLYHVSLWHDIRFPVGKIWEDIATLYKVFLQVEKVSLVHGDMYYYFINSESTTGGRWTPRYFEEIEAYENQLKEKRIINNQIISPCLREQFIYRIYRQLRDVGKAEITDKERKRYEARLKTKLRHVLRKFSKGTKFDFNNSKYFYEIAYPIEMKYYWYWKALTDKFGRK